MCTHIKTKARVEAAPDESGAELVKWAILCYFFMIHRNFWLDCTALPIGSCCRGNHQGIMNDNIEVSGIRMAMRTKF